MAPVPLLPHPLTQPDFPVPGPSWLRFGAARARSFRVTRQGKYYLAVTAGVGLAAVNTGNNLLYLLLGLLLSLLIVSGVLSELSIANLTVLRRLPPRAQVDQLHLVEVEVFNHKKRVPSYAVEVEDLRDGFPADKRCFFLKVAPGASQVAAYRRTPLRRGLTSHTGFRIATRFPFGLFEKSRRVRAEDSIIVYPAVDPVRPTFSSTTPHESLAFTQRTGEGDDLLGLRPFHEGDDPRHIFWKKSAISPQPVVLHRAAAARYNFDRHIDNTFAKDEDRASRADHLERAIRVVASDAAAHLARGDEVTLHAANGSTFVATTGTDLEAMLRYLALLPLVPFAEGK